MNKYTNPGAIKEFIRKQNSVDIKKSKSPRLNRNSSLSPSQVSILEKLFSRVNGFSKIGTQLTDDRRRFDIAP